MTAGSCGVTAAPGAPRMATGLGTMVRRLAGRANYSFGMGRIRHNRVLIAWLTMMAVLGNLVAGLACSLPVPRQAPDEMLGVICSSHGAPVADQQAPAPEPRKPCELCIVAASAVLLPVLMLILLVLSVDTAPPRLRRAVPCIARRAGGGALGSRAPPLPA